jgi:hypothetical protein
MNNPDLPTPTEILNALNTLGQCSTQIGRKPLQDAVELLASSYDSGEAPYALWLYNKHAFLALRNFSEAVCHYHDQKITDHVRASDFAEAHALRLYRRASCEFMASTDDANETAVERYIQKIGDETPETEAEYNDCCDHI